MHPTSFTGRARRRTTSPLVRLGDRAARWTIAGGGLATIGAVGLVCVFLLWVVLPLLRTADLGPLQSATTAGPDRILHQSVDAYGRLAWHLGERGRLVAFLLTDGDVLEQAQLFDPAEVSSMRGHGRRLLLGRRDGSVQFLEAGFSAEDLAAVDPGVAGLAVGATTRQGPGLIERTGPGQFRGQRLQVRREDPIALAQLPIVAVDFTEGPRGPVFAALDAGGTLHLESVRRRHNLLLDREETTLVGGSRPLVELGLADLAARPPAHLLLAGAGDSLCLIWPEGSAVRLDVRDLEHPTVAERLQLLDGGDARLTALGSLIGQTTLVVGDSRGRVRLFFRTRPTDARGTDGSQLELAREFTVGDAPVTTVAASERSRLLLCGLADGTAQVLHGTSQRVVAGFRLPEAAPVMAASIAPKEDAVVLASPGAVARWQFAPGHPEVTLASVFLPVWYEGYTAPAHVWQSTGGTDDVEPKYGLWPLIFGTLKATLYCMLLGVPLALLAAIYTSEFLHRRWRARVKPLIEMMASLPSVVLGFLAALVFAPVVEAHLTTVLAMFLAVPLVLLSGAQIWQAVPVRLRPLLERWRLPAMVAVLPLSLPLAVLLGDAGERLLFGSDLRGWLAATSAGADDAARGSALGGWLLLLLPAGGLLAAWLPGRLAAPRLGPLRFLLGLAIALAAAAGLALLPTAAGWDLRGSLVGTYEQRNSLVVGFAMGFAVVPIIYTIAEDALTAVPDHLRAASLGSGATPWQTAMRIVLPTAMSGIFSAVMIGLGRAVGETMIVLMAAGNTPVLDLNIFNGFRTLSANIAVELPEAVPNSTHYRMLFLAAFCLFAMTFLLNTGAELVRQRFRRRAYQL